MVGAAAGVEARHRIPLLIRLVGVGLVAVSAAAFGTLAIFGRLAYAAGMDTFTILFLRFGLAAMLMLGWLALRRERLPRGPVLARLAGMGALGYIGQAFSYLTALNYASAGLVALLLYLYPVFVALLAVGLLRERLTRGKVAALALAVAGAALTVNPEGGQPVGIALAISAAAIYSVYIIAGTGVMKHVSAVQSSTVIFASAGLAAGGLMLIDGPRLPNAGAGWWVIAAIVLIATVIPVVTFLAGLERIGPTNAAMLSTLEPVVTVLLAAWLLGETLAPRALLGGVLILLAVLVVTRGELQRRSEHGG
jgi:drug/metabolite transporter (DMT)-like permease